MQFYALVFLLVASTSLYPHYTLGHEQLISGTSDPLRHWLYDLTIPLPNISIPLPFKKQLDLLDITCTHILLQSVNSHSQTQTKSYQVALLGLGLSCNGKYTVDNKTFAPVILNITDTSKLKLGINFLQETSFELPTKADPFDVVVDLHLSIQLDDAPKWIQDIVNIIDNLLAPVINKQAKEGLEGLVRSNLTQVLQSLNSTLEPFMHPPSHPPPPTAPPGSANLSHSPLLDVLSFFLDSGFHRGIVNAVVDDLTNGTGNAIIDLKNITINLPLGEVGTIQFGFSNITIGGLDTWANDTAFFKVHDTYNLLTRTDLDKLVFNISWFVSINLTTHSDVLTEEAILSLGLSDAILIADIFLAINTNSLDNLPTSRLFDVACLLSATSDINATALYINFTTSLLDVTAATGSFEQDIDDVVNNLVALLLPMYGPTVPFVLNSLVFETLRLEANVDASKALMNATCPPEHKINKVDESALAGYLASAGATVLFIVIGLVLFAYGRRIAKRNRASKKKDKVVGTNGWQRRSSNFSFSDEHETTALLASRIDRTSSPAICLAMEPSVSTTARYGVPFLLLATIAVFIFSNNSPGASVIPQITLNDDVIVFEPLFSFDLTNSVRDMWFAKVYALSILIGAFSGTWPYMKLLLMLAAWLLPVSWLSVNRRETMLRVLDALGKWSLIDSFVLVMMLVAFRFHLPFRHSEDDPTVASFDIIVRPEIGIHTFLIATIASLTLSHIILHIHRDAADFHRERKATEEEKQSLARHCYVNGSGEMYQITLAGTALLIGTLLLSIGLSVFGGVIEAFMFEFKGLAALAMDYDDINPNRNFSLISIGTAIPASVSNPNSVSIRYIQAIFYSIAFGIPLIHLSSLVLIWCLPLKACTQEKLFLLSEVLNAWSCLDVFVVSLLAAVLEIQQFAQFIIGDMCDPINALLKPHVHDWPKLRDDPKCFDVVTDLKQGSWFLFSAAIVSTIATWIVMPLCHRALRERVYGAKHQADQKLHTVNSMSEMAVSSPKCGRLLSLFEILHIVEYVGMEA